jgi:hypothetical protein
MVEHPPRRRRCTGCRTRSASVQLDHEGACEAEMSAPAVSGALPSYVCVILSFLSISHSRSLTVAHAIHYSKYSLSEHQLGRIEASVWEFSRVSLIACF